MIQVLRGMTIVFFMLALSACGGGGFKTSQSQSQSETQDSQTDLTPPPLPADPDPTPIATIAPNPAPTPLPEPVITISPNPTPDPIVTIAPNPTPQPEPVPPAETVRYITLTPAILPFSAPEIVNPLRGLYKWRGNQIVNIGESPADTYQRYEWNDIETSRDVYDFSQIERDFNAAVAEGSRFAFRIRSMVGYGTREVAMPSYLQNCGWWTNNTFVPDWNAECYLERVERLFTALGNRFGRDPRISFIDIGMYGQYGEWNLSSSEVNYANAPSGMTPMTTASARRIIDAHVRAFPQTQLLMKLLSREGSEWTRYAYDLPTAIPIGSRIDCIGRVGYFRQWTNRPEIWDTLKDRWRVAPMIGEYCSGEIALDTADSRDDALGHVEDFHFSAVGNGNMTYWSTLSSSDRDLFYQIGKRAGYRMELRRAEYPTSFTRGQAGLRLNLQFFNSGVAPVYEPWRVYAILRDKRSGTVAAKILLSYDIRRRPINTIESVSENLAIPSTVVAGTYQVELAIEATDGFRKNLKLANENPSSDKSRLILGDMTIR